MEILMRAKPWFCTFSGQQDGKHLLSPSGQEWRVEVLFGLARD